jgi:hypothetical protein
MGLPVLDMVLNLGRKHGWKHRVTYWHIPNYLNMKGGGYVPRVMRFLGPRDHGLVRKSNQIKIRINRETNVVEVSMYYRKAPVDQIYHRWTRRVSLYDPDSLKRIEKLFK